MSRSRRREEALTWSGFSLRFLTLAATRFTGRQRPPLPGEGEGFLEQRFAFGPQGGVSIRLVGQPLMALLKQTVVVGGATEERGGRAWLKPEMKTKIFIGEEFFRDHCRIESRLVYSSVQSGTRTGFAWGTSLAS